MAERIQGGGQRSQSARRRHDCRILSTSKDWLEPGLRQDTGDLRALVTLNLDPSLLHRASSTTGLLHFLRKFFFFRQTDAEKPRGNRHGLATAVRRLAYDVHPTTVLLCRFRGSGMWPGSSLRIVYRRQLYVF